MGAKVFSDNDLRYAARARCRCGAGLAYVIDRDDRKKETGDFWICSSLLTRDINMRYSKEGNVFGGGIIETEDGVEHDQAFSFAFFEIKSECQPSQNGATTRTDGVVHCKTCENPAWQCRCEKQRDTYVKQ